MEGYKVFEPDWTCDGFQYEVGKIFECSKGFYFYKELYECFDDYSFAPYNKVARIIPLGEVSKKINKYCANKIKIVEEISWEDVLRIIGIGKENTGLWNSGNYNSGNGNSGNHNSGNWNRGDWNSGDCNSGIWNTGNYNIGHRNSGSHNKGNFNSGDYNKTSFSNGCFNTEEAKIFLFNKPSNWTYHDWSDSNAKYLLKQIPNEPEHRQSWWDSLSEKHKITIKALPNFNKEIFEDIIGIKI